jgi:hypothetical protein
VSLLHALLHTIRISAASRPDAGPIQQDTLSGEVPKQAPGRPLSEDADTFRAAHLVLRVAYRELAGAGLKGESAEPVVLLGGADEPPFADEGQRNIRVGRLDLTGQAVP